MWMMWWCMVTGASAQAGTKAVLVNGTDQPMDPEFVLIGRTVCDPCSGPIPPGGVRTLELGDATRLIVDLVGPTWDGTHSLRFSGNSRSGGSSGVSVQSTWTEVAGGQLVTLVVLPPGSRPRARPRHGFAPGCGAMVDELRACTPTVCEQGGKVVMVETLPGGGCLLKQQELSSFGRGGGQRSLRCEASTTEARAGLVDLFETAASFGQWPHQELASSPLCETVVETNPAVGHHRVVWMNESSVPVELGALGTGCSGCAAQGLAPGASAGAAIEPGGITLPVPISGGGMDLLLDLSKGGLRTKLVGDALHVDVIQEMNNGQDTTSTVVFTDAP